MDKSGLLDSLGASGEERLFLSRILDRRLQASKRGGPVSTDFLSPREQALARSLLRMAPPSDAASQFYGGPPDAERKRLCFFPDWLSPEPEAFGVRALRARWTGSGALTHRDLLGSLMALGIVRGKIGDIYVRDGAADVLTLESVHEFLLGNWRDAGRVRLRVEAIDAEGVRAPVPDVEEYRVTVNSLRLDAILAAGLRLSRSKAAELTEAGRVQVNWFDCAKPDRALQAGDLLSVRGFGRLSIADVGPPTRKGRLPVIIRRFV